MAGNIAKNCWQGNGQLTIGNTAQNVGFQADFPRSGYYTIQFDVQLPPRSRVNTTEPGEIAARQLVFPRAEIFWSVEGNQVRRLINLAKGVAISGAGQAVRVRMFDYSILNINTREPNYTVSAQVVRGTRPTGAGSKPPILEVAGTLSPGAGAIVDDRGIASTLIIPGNNTGSWYVPNDAGVASFYLGIESSVGGVVPPYTNNDINVSQIPAFIAGTPNLGSSNYDSFNSWIPLSPSADLVQVTNTTANAVIVTLHWGVEG